MKFKVYESIVNGFRYKIKEDYPEVGAYLYGYKNGTECIFDYLQNDVQMCKEFAEEEFGVPIDSWVRMNDIESKHFNKNKILQEFTEKNTESPSKNNSLLDFLKFRK